MRKARFKPYKGPAGGWGSAQSVGEILLRERAPFAAGKALLKQNKPIDGFACVSCAWAKPHPSLPLAFCENGAKATAWEGTALRCGPEFFARHTLRELRNWSDYELEQQGRLTEPLRWDAASDRYLPISWAQAFAEIGAELKGYTDPNEVVFYASGRASLEASYMWALYARLYGTNNLPDSSNMCHESTSIALPESIGVPVGTVTLNDFAKTDGLLFFGHNTGSNAPRMLHELEAARKRNAPIITFNPLRERGLERFTNPQSPVQMATGESIVVSTQYHQLAIGGDIACIAGICKALFEMDDAARERGAARVLDVAFIAKHTAGFEAFERRIRGYAWPLLERRSGLTRGAMEAAATVYAGCERVIAVYGMGLTQHRHGVLNVQMLVNLLLLRGNMGKEGAGICPVRGHSNVQGQRSVGITEKAAQVPADKLRERFGFEPPSEDGMNTVEACEAIVAGKVKAFVALGGNFIRAIPDSGRLEPAWSSLKLSVQIATKLNRSHLVHGEKAYLLPCLGRTEVDVQASGEQRHTTEDSTACIRAWRGVAAPAGEHLLSEPAIIAALAKATLAPNPAVDWDAWVADYGLVREAIAATYPETFHDLNVRMMEPGGFHRPLGASQRQWKTSNGKANFIEPHTLSVDDDVEQRAERRDVLNLMTIRSNDQFNTTVYGYNDRFRGIHGTRAVLLMHRNDIARLNLAEGDKVQVSTAVDDGVHREVGPLRVTPYDIPEGCCAGYYPECNALIPLWHHAEKAKVPAAKSIPVTLRRVIAVGQDASVPVEPAPLPG
ncbi:FdhF/YdeP family oxidoreductase [Pseudomonas kuykendallii]|uniref:Oxidoreductase alpha (Molybdopterin) subunit n=1 Tax=Pseudomonas kuykendallii TaxID=1007099 RepID=A0A1H2TEZ6_9PSED|nr:FdhF/YdeP family oxidoreductase [Pseudomonas kuykendallii]MCQ4272171.1 FdhF/YdeP family oxidoreductase [Pseudomonas kuykendallii]SDW42255.1 oxidoreductase alpha (molybdopterin) subunit [Pseudomonas kuykendallii]